MCPFSDTYLTFKFSPCIGILTLAPFGLDFVTFSVVSMIGAFVVSCCCYGCLSSWEGVVVDAKVAVEMVVVVFKVKGFVVVVGVVVENWGVVVLLHLYWHLKWDMNL